MYEDDVFEALELLKILDEQNTLDLKKSGISNSEHQLGDRFHEGNKNYNLTDQVTDLPSSIFKPENSMKYGKMNLKMNEAYSKNTNIFPNKCLNKPLENSRRRQKYQIEVHKSKAATGSIKEKIPTDENTATSNNPVTKKGRLIDRLRCYMNSESSSPSTSGITITVPIIQELVNTTEIRKEYTKERTYDHSDSETTTVLDDAMQYFETGNDNQHLFYGRSNSKRCVKGPKIQESDFLEREFQKQFPDHHKMHEKHHIKTLGDSISYFGLSSLLQELETSLEEVRRNEKSKEDHEECFKRIDKEIQKLSFKYHPDKVKNRGGTENDITTGQELQTALNGSRTALKLLNSAFMEDIGTDHKFGFYTNLNIDSLCNEDEMKYRIYEVIFKIGVISRIKQQNIISEIRKFLIESKGCVRSYLGNLDDFEKCRDLALFHLKCCIKGFKKLCRELDEVKEQCIAEKNSKNMYLLIKKMASDSKRDVELLKSLKKIAKASMKGKYQFFSPKEEMDPYFVLPLVAYTNLILMCNVMVRSSSVFDILNINFNPNVDPYYRDDLSFMMHPFYLVSYFSGNMHHKKIALTIMGKKELIQQGMEVHVSKEEIELEFYKGVEQINEFMEYKFRVEAYNETMPANLLVLDLKKCMCMMSEFEEKQEEVSRGIKEFQKKTEKMDEKYERFEEMMKATEELNQKVKERLEQNKKFSEKVSCSLSDHL